MGYISEPVLIDEDRWIGYNVMILAWIIIWRASILRVNAVVTKKFSIMELLEEGTQNYKI